MINNINLQVDWYKRGFSSFPFPIASSYKKLYETVEQSDLYQAMLRCKDLTELLAKYLDFCIAGELIAKDQEFPINEWLIGNQSFGKWVSWFGANHIKSTLWPENFGILIKKYYDHSKIVNWRNDTIGHGVVGIKDRVPEIWIDICAQISSINQLFQEIGNILTHLIPVDDTGMLIDGNYDLRKASRMYLSPDLSLYPFILIIEDDFLFFNSIRGSTPKYVSILSGSPLIRTEEKSWFFIELEKINPLIDRKEIGRAHV